MSSNNFQENFVFGTQKYRPLLDIFYKHFCYNERFVCIGDIEKSSFSDLLQRKLKVDIIIQTNPKESYAVEEKVVAWPKCGKPYTALFLETDSCTNPGHESKGWMALSQADLLLYALVIERLGLVIYLIDFPQLKQWFWKKYLPNLSRPEYGVSVMPDENRTKGRVVAIKDIVQAVPTSCFLVTFDGEYCELKPDVDIQWLRTEHLRGVAH